MATYPGSLKTYTNKVDGVDTVLAADINSVQSEVQAIEAELGTTPKTSIIGNTAGTYTTNGSGITTVSARLTNLEAGLTANAADGSRIGYTQIDSKTLTATGSGGSVSFTSIPASYQKLVIQVDFTSITTGTLVSVTLNNITTAGSYIYARQEYTNSQATFAAPATNKTQFELGTLTTTYNQYVIEIPNYSRSNTGKVVTALAGSLSLTGFQTTATAVTRVDVILASAGNATATVTLLGVK
jgi:hypothetical protein